MEIIVDRTHNDGYSLIYETFDLPEQYMYSKKLVRYILDSGYYLWDVSAKLSNSTPILHYYIIAKTKRSAREKYLKKLPYMHILSIAIIEEDKAKDILNHPAQFCIW